MMLPPITMSKQTEFNRAIQIARQKINEAGFDDVIEQGFHVVGFTTGQMHRLGLPTRFKGWYLSGSIDLGRGFEAFVQIDVHGDALDMADTILHELGHAIWELLDETSRRRWQAECRSEPEEIFADDCSFFLMGKRSAMHNRQLFEAITAQY